MDREQILERYAQRVGFTPDELASLDREGSRARHLERIMEAAAKHSIVARVTEASNCNSGYQTGDRFVLDVDGNFIAKLCPKRICVYLAGQMQVPVALVNERLSEGLEPNAFHFMRTVSCLDCGMEKGGYGKVEMQISVQPRQ